MFILIPLFIKLVNPVNCLPTCLLQINNPFALLHGRQMGGALGAVAPP